MPKNKTSSLANLNFIKLWLSLTLITLLLSFYINLKQHSANFLRSINDHISYLKLDLDITRNTYYKQLLYYKNALQNKPLNKQYLENFFASPNLALLDKKAIRLIIITDKDFNILFAEGIDEASYKNIKIDQRDYKAEVIQRPNEVVFGKVVNGVLSKEPSLPIATGLIDSKDNFNGAIVFSVNLTALNLILAKNNLVKISFDDIDTNNEAKQNSAEINHKPIRFFLNKALLDPHSKIRFGVEDAINNNLILLTYDISKIQQSFWQDYLLHAAIICSVMLLIGMVFYYFVYKPLLPLIRVASNNVSIFDVNQHLFHNVGKLANYYGSLENAKLIIEGKERVIQLMRKYYSFLINSNSTKASFLSEDIDDLISSYKINNSVIDDQLLENIYKISQNNEYEVNFAAKFIEMILLETIKNSLEKVNLFDVLLEAGIREENIKIDNSTSSVKDGVNYLEVLINLEGFFIKELLLKFFLAILDLVASNGNLSQVLCSKNEDKIYINFSCSNSSFPSEQQELNLFKCNALALANFAKLGINYQENEIQITVIFSDLVAS